MLSVALVRLTRLCSLQEARDEVNQVRDTAIGNQAVLVAGVFVVLVSQRNRFFLANTRLQVDNVASDGVENRLAGAGVPLVRGILGEKVNACVILDDLEELVARAVRDHALIAGRLERALAGFGRRDDGDFLTIIGGGVFDVVMVLAVDASAPENLRLVLLLLLSGERLIDDADYRLTGVLVVGANQHRGANEPRLFNVRYVGGTGACIDVLGGAIDGVDPNRNLAKIDFLLDVWKRLRLSWLDHLVDFLGKRLCGRLVPVEDLQQHGFGSRSILSYLHHDTFTENVFKLVALFALDVLAQLWKKLSHVVLDSFLDDNVRQRLKIKLESLVFLFAFLLLYQ